MRRVVMVGTVDGRAVVTRDDRVAPRVLDVFPGAEFYLLWGSDRVPALPSTGERPTDTWIPGPDGARFGISVIPSGYGLTVDDLRTGLPEIERELPGLAPTLEPDHPGVHTTATLDFVLVVSGNITLELDDGQTVDASAGDCIVQAGTRHAWRNHSGEPCVLAISMVGTRLSSEDDPDQTRPSGEI